MMITPELQAYNEALEELYYVNRSFAALAQGMGQPSWDTTCDTAYVEYVEHEQRIRFAFNPDFILSLTKEEAAAVIAHEAHHVVLDHLIEAASGQYQDANALYLAQECIINDTVESVFRLILPGKPARGMDLVNTDCSPLSSRQVYDLLTNDKSEDQDEDGQAGGDNAGSSQGSSSGAGGSGTEASEADQPNSGAGDAKNDTGPDGAKPDGAGGEADNDEPGAGESDTETDSDAGQGSDKAAGSCSGVRVPDGVTATQLVKAVMGAIGSAAAEAGMTEAELVQELTNDSPGGFSLTGQDLSDQAVLSKERMNWRKLLAKINPKVMESGRPRRKTRNDWTSYNRRMGAVYPKVILPRSVPVEAKKDDDGDQKPVMVIALDLSGSIPRSLVKTLQGLLNEIPRDLIEAYPCTWADTLYPYEERGRVASGGTNINSVVRYVKEVKAKTGKDPYVLVISDGEFPTKHDRPGRDWYFMAVNKASVKTMTQARSGWGGTFGGQVKPGEECYLVDDFRI